MQCMCKENLLTLVDCYDNVVMQHGANIAIILGVSAKLFTAIRILCTTFQSSMRFQFPLE